MWTLILTLTIVGTSTHTVVIPNLPTREICRQTGENHIEKHQNSAKELTGWRGYVGVYTCVEMK